MSKTETIRIRMEPSIKKAVETIFTKLGLSPTEAITMFYHQVKIQRAIPFELSLPRTPNKKTQKVLREVMQGKNMRTYNSVDEMMRKLEK